MKWMNLALLAFPLALNAGEVIMDTGKTVSAEKYRHDLDASYPQPEKASIGKLIMPMTPELTVGRVQKRAINLPLLPNPIFLVGTDRTSLAWLTKHANALKKAGAKGFIVNSDSAENLQTILRTADGIEMSPVSGSELAARFKINHYPVLITKNQIAQ